jgi:hypothetical protein
MMRSALISMALLAVAGGQAQAQTSTQTGSQAPIPGAAAQTDPDVAVDLEDIVVEGRRLEDATREFVTEVGAPARGRGLARWRDGVCIGVANLRPETAQYIADRISTVAQDLGLKPGAPGCHPSVLIIATIDANEFTEQFVAMRPRLFIVGGSGMDRGYTALGKFKTNDQPIRWWTVSVPVNADNGEVAVRLPGRDPPMINTFAASRLTTQIVNDTKRSFVIVDVDKIGGVNLQQLSDYLAMVVLAQIDPEGDTSSYATVLNVFDDPSQTEGLTNWDRAYLGGLYNAERRRANGNTNRAEIADSIMRVHNRMTDERNRAEDAANAAADDAAQDAPETPETPAP